MSVKKKNDENEHKAMMMMKHKNDFRIFYWYFPFGFSLFTPNRVSSFCLKSPYNSFLDNRDQYRITHHCRCFELGELFSDKNWGRLSWKQTFPLSQAATSRQKVRERKKREKFNVMARTDFSGILSFLKSNLMTTTFSLLASLAWTQFAIKY